MKTKILFFFLFVFVFNCLSFSEMMISITKLQTPSGFFKDLETSHPKNINNLVLGSSSLEESKIVITPEINGDDITLNFQNLSIEDLDFDSEFNSKIKISKSF